MLCSLLGLFLTAGAARADAEEIKKLQGAWKCTHTEIDGAKTPDEVRNKDDFVLREMIVKDNTLSFRIYSVKEKKTETLESKDMKFEVDVTKKPKQVQWTFLDDKNKIKSIYSLEGDTLKVAIYLEKGNMFPPTLETKKGDGIYVYVFQRMK
jgi:uncharacterized protein (TIGR03067 family)